jgi:transposase-like protein
MSEATTKRRIYTKEFNHDAVNLSKSPGYTLVAAARSLGISESALRRWRKELAANGPLAFPGNGKEALTSAEIENRELRKRLRDVEIERDILKKAAGIFPRVPQ